MWQIKLNAQSAKTLKQLDKSIKQRLEAFIDDLSVMENPRSKGTALQGHLKNFWRYRVGAYRLIVEIKDRELIILVVELGHRSDVYKTNQQSS